MEELLASFLISHMILIADSGHTTSQARHSKHKFGSVTVMILFLFLMSLFDLISISAGQLLTHFKHRIHRLLSIRIDGGIFLHLILLVMSVDQSKLYLFRYLLCEVVYYNLPLALHRLLYQFCLDFSFVQVSLYF